MWQYKILFYSIILTFTFDFYALGRHLFYCDFFKSDLQCIQGIYFISSFPADGPSILLLIKYQSYAHKKIKQQKLSTLDHYRVIAAEKSALPSQE